MGESRRNTRKVQTIASIPVDVKEAPQYSVWDRHRFVPIIRLIHLSDMYGGEGEEG